MASEVINVPTLGPEADPPLSDATLGQIVSGLCIPNQAAGKSMAKELIAARAALEKQGKGESQ